MATSKPVPAITLNVLPLHTAVSMLRRSPRAIPATISLMSVGRSRPEAKRLAVPLGTTASAVGVPTMASEAARTLPSPPQTITVAAPCLIAFAAAGLASDPFSISIHSTSLKSASVRARRRAFASFFVSFSVLAMTAMFDIGSSGLAVAPTRPLGRSSFGASILVLLALGRTGQHDDRRDHRCTAEQRTEHDVGEEVHASVHAGHADAHRQDHGDRDRQRADPTSAGVPEDDRRRSPSRRQPQPCDRTDSSCPPATCRGGERRVGAA